MKPNTLMKATAAAHIVDVLYTSSWEEGDIETKAKLDLKTGVVFDVESSNEGEEFEILIEEYIEDPTGKIRATVEQAGHGYKVEFDEELKALQAHFNFSQ